MHHSLLDDWRLYCSYFPSPDSYIDMAFYEIISSSLQRRIWTGPVEKPLFPHMYVVLVGPPSTGKGLVIQEAEKILRHHKLYTKSPMGGMSKEARAALETANKTIIDNNKSLKEEKLKKGEEFEEPLLFPMAASTTTFESLVQEHAKAVRTFNTKEPHPFALNKIYIHNSMSFCLEELASLFDKHADKLITYLIQAWDAGRYEYRTKHFGTDIIRKCCLNFLAGTTPSFMRDAFSSKYTEDGYTSRVIFVYEHKPRFECFDFPEFTQDMRDARQRIIDRIGYLATLFGQVNYTPDALEYLRNFFINVHPNHRPNFSTKLEYYYARKKTHVQKLAMAMHFADYNTMEISLVTAQRALAYLEELETRMHHALSTISENNPVAKPARKILKFLATGPKTDRQISIEMEGDPVRHDAIEWLKETGQVEKVHGEITDHLTGKKPEMWQIIRNQET